MEMALRYAKNRLYGARTARSRLLAKLGGFVCFPMRQPQSMSPHREAALGALGGFSLGRAATQGALSAPRYSHSGSARASVLRRSPRRDHQYRTPLPDGDDLLDRLAVLLPWDFHDQSVGPFPSLEVGTADHPVALAAAQPSERMRLTSNNSRLRVQGLYLYATHHPTRTGRPLGQATYHARGRAPSYKRNHRICFGLESLGQDWR